MRLILCEYLHGYTGQYYQEVDQSGIIVNLRDMDGNIFKLPEAGEEGYMSYSATVVDDNPTVSWNVDPQ